MYVYVEYLVLCVNERIYVVDIFLDHGKKVVKDMLNYLLKFYDQSFVI